MKTCSVGNCPDGARKRGWCNAHYIRWRRHGDVNYVAPMSVVELSNLAKGRKGNQQRYLARIETVEELLDMGADPLDLHTRAGYASKKSLRRALSRADRPDLVASYNTLSERPRDTGIPVVRGAGSKVIGSRMKMQQSSLTNVPAFKNQMNRKTHGSHLRAY